MPSQRYFETNTRTRAKRTPAAARMVRHAETSHIATLKLKNVCNAAQIMLLWRGQKCRNHNILYGGLFRGAAFLVVWGRPQSNRILGGGGG